MFGNEFQWGKTNDFNPSGLNMATVWLTPITSKNGKTLDSNDQNQVADQRW